MTLPFTPDEFFAVFARMHASAWPAVALAHLLSVIVLAGVAARAHPCLFAIRGLPSAGSR